MNMRELMEKIEEDWISDAACEIEMTGNDTAMIEGEAFHVVLACIKSFVWTNQRTAEEIKFPFEIGKKTGEVLKKCEGFEGGGNYVKEYVDGLREGIKITDVEQLNEPNDKRVTRFFKLIDEQIKLSPCNDKTLHFYEIDDRDRGFFYGLKKAAELAAIVWGEKYRS
jgi:hypothetical protein